MRASPWHPAALLLLLAPLVTAVGCGYDQAGCQEVVQSICKQREGCAGMALPTCIAEVTKLVLCAQGPQCPPQTGFDWALSQCQTDQETATCQDLLAGHIATNCTQTCR